MGWLQSLGFGRRRQSGSLEFQQQDTRRKAGYARCLRAYQGYSVRGTLGSSVPTETKRVAFNFSRPIANLGAAFLCGGALGWEVDDDEAATATAEGIWDRSGSDRAMLEHALTAGIYGDAVLLATQGADGQPRVECIDPSLCLPTFDGADYSKLIGLEIAYEVTDRQGERILHREIYDETSLTVYDGDTEDTSRSLTYDVLPAAWVRNLSVPGSAYGLSDLDGILDLVEQYDHLCGKQTQIIDYYAGPTIVIQGVQKSDEIKKDMRTVLWLPGENADAHFLEWSGNVPAVEEQLTRIRNAIAEVSQVPAVAFGQADSGLSQISGVALRILYGPLLAKTAMKQANWGPALERVMWRALVTAGHDVPLEAVNVRWPCAVPEDVAALVADEVSLVTNKLKSRRTAMTTLGIENPGDELKRVVVEQKLLEAAAPAPMALQGPPGAMAGGKGMPAGKPGAPGQKAALAQAPTEQDIATAVEELLAKFDEIVAAEEDNLAQGQAREGAGEGEGAE
ncbi:MAG TPA: phage portal protein [Armatimonadota bacterium]|jgi:SPP1 family phage portal protein